MITKNKKQDFNINLEEMIEAGLHLGHQTSRVHPKMKPYIHSAKNGIHIIDLEKTIRGLEEALGFIQEITSENKILAIVGTKIQAKNLVKTFATECDLPFVNERWLGGTFTNFEIIKKRTAYFKELEKEKIEGELEKYTKKEKANFDKELQNLETKFGGIKNMERLPYAVLVLDMKKDDLAIKEAKAKGIKIIGISDTNVNPNLIDYPIPANDDTISSLMYILEKVKLAVEVGREIAQEKNKIEEIKKDEK